MRLKCRFWDSKKSRFIYVDLKNKADWRKWKIEFCFMNYEVEWFTEFHDRKTKEIYEGDVVEFHFGKGIIVWEQNQGSFYIQKSDEKKEGKSINYGLGNLIIKQMLVIGNIRENPDLLTIKEEI